MKRLTGFVVLVLSLALGFGCAAIAQVESKVETAAPAVTLAPAAEMVKTELFFGRNIPSGHEISAIEFDNFLENVVTKYFPQGLTVYDAYGQMKESTGIIEKQSTYVVLIVHEKTQENSNAIQEIINAYRKQFSMAEVMCLVSPVESKFYTE